MIYHIVDSNEYFDDIEDAIEYCIDEDYHRDDEYFEEWVNDCYGRIEIAGRTFYAYEIINSMDDELYSSLRDDYMESENENDRENTRYELRHARIGAVVDCQAYEIEVCADEESGDYDGDEHFEGVTAIEIARESIEAARRLDEARAADEKKDEDKIMSMFQVIHG